MENWLYGGWVMENQSVSGLIFGLQILALFIFITYGKFWWKLELEHFVCLASIKYIGLYCWCAASEQGWWWCWCIQRWGSSYRFVVRDVYGNFNQNKRIMKNLLDSELRNYIVWYHVIIIIKMYFLLTFISYLFSTWTIVQSYYNLSRCPIETW